jgi:tRNA pseudouridine38-40 synthase
LTVQSVFESALAQVLGHTVRTTAAGRTDAGVHADAQVVSFSTTSTLPASALPAVLPQHLPADTWVIDAAEAPLDFDARRSALRRWYQYAVWRAPEPPSTAWQGRALPVSEQLDLPAMRHAAVHLLGRHDFRGFSSPPPDRSTVRTVFAADWLELGPVALFEICADAFLTHMVRTIVGGLLWVGREHWTLEHFTAALRSADRRDAGPNAPPLGLTLARIEY